jgi:hypothetical protein
MDVVKKNIRKDWDWIYLSMNTSISWNDIKNNINRTWDWFYVSINSSITWDDIINNPKERWNWHGISKNPNITWDIIKDNMDKPWDWNFISENPSITLDDIKNNPDKPWNWHCMYHNYFCYDPYFISPIYKKKLVKKFMDNCFRELIEKSCTVERKLNWDEDFMEDCKNEFYIGGRDFYLAECEKFRFAKFLK